MQCFNGTLQGDAGSGSRLSQRADSKVNSHRKLGERAHVSGNCVCLCVCVSWLPLLLLRRSDNDNELIATLKITRNLI